MLIVSDPAAFSMFSMLFPAISSRTVMLPVARLNSPAAEVIASAVAPAV